NTARSLHHPQSSFRGSHNLLQTLWTPRTTFWFAMETVHNIPVLMYHHVTNRGGFLDVSARQFERQIKWLAENGYTALSADGFAAFLNGGATPEKSVVLTFDDGDLDNWGYAHRILKRYGMKAVLFVATGLIGTGAPRAHTGQGRALPLCPSHQQAKDKMF